MLGPTLRLRMLCQQVASLQTVAFNQPRALLAYQMNSLNRTHNIRTINNVQNKPHIDSNESDIGQPKKPIGTETTKSLSDESEAVYLAQCATKERDGSPEDTSKPTEEQLQAIANRLGEHLPKFFKVPHEFRLYNRNIIFEDNIRGVRAVGLNQYAWQIALIKMGAHFKYGKVAMNILKITSHIEDGTVRVRWRIETYPGNNIVFAFWQFKMWKAKESLDAHKDEWIDGFSIFQLGGDGLIHKHVCDKVIPDQDKVVEAKKTSLAMKLGIALGLVPGASEGFGAEDLLTKIYEILSNL